MLDSKTVIKRKRSARFWLLLAAAILFGLPLLLYAILLAYVNLGFLNSSVADRISKKLGAPAHIGSIRSNVFQSFSLQNIAIDPSGSGEALTIGATRLDYSLTDVLRNGHLRSLSIERPQLDLRYDPAKGWNHTLKLAPESGEGLRIDSVDIRDGTLALGWGAKGRFKLAHIDAAFGSAPGTGAAPFKLHATLESTQSLSVETTSDTSGAFTGALAVGLDLDSDLNAILGAECGLKGLAHLDLAATRAAKTSAKPDPDPIDLTGTFRATFASIGELAPPDFNLTGPITGHVVTESGLAKRAHLTLDLAGESAAKASVFDLASALFSGAAPKTAASLRVDFARDDSGTWRSVSEVNDLSLPLASLGRAAKLAEKTGLKLGGFLSSKKIHFDSASAVCSGSFTLADAEVRYLIPQRLLAEASKSLTASGNEKYAMALNSLSATGIKGIAGTFSFTHDHGVSRLNGRTAPVLVFATALGADFTEMTLPAADIVMESRPAADGSCAIKFGATWASGQLVADLHGHGEAWTYDARFNENALTSEIRFEGAVDRSAATAGPFTITTDVFKLSSLGTLLQSVTKLDFSTSTTEARGVRIRIEPFSIDPAKPHALTIHAAADGASSGEFALSKQDVAIDINSGGVFLRSPFEWTEHGKPLRAEPQRLDLRSLMRIFR